MTTALILLFPGVEEIEAVTTIDLLRRAGVEVTTATITSTTTVTGRNEIPLGSDTTLDAVGEKAFDALILPGGPGVKHLRAAPNVLARIRKQAETGRLVAAICAAPTVLKDAGLLAGRRYTAHFSVAGELGEMIEAEPVVVDGNLVTSRGAGTAPDFALALIRQLVSVDAAEKVAESICLPR